MRRNASIVAGILLLLAVGFIHSRWTNPQRAAEAAAAATDRLALFPMVVGDWVGKPSELDDRQRKLSGADGILARNYVHRQSGDRMKLILIYGRPGPVSAHTPDVCYQGLGNSVGTPTDLTLELKGPPGTARFKSISVKSDERSADSFHLEVLWSWSGDGNWSNPTSPRWTFARYPILYKLYVVRPVGDGETSENNPATQFIHDVLPELQKYLFPAD